MFHGLLLFHSTHYTTSTFMVIDSMKVSPKLLAIDPKRLFHAMSHRKSMTPSVSSFFDYFKPQNSVLDAGKGFGSGRPSFL